MGKYLILVLNWQQFLIVGYKEKGGYYYVKFKIKFIQISHLKLQ